MHMPTACTRATYRHVPLHLHHVLLQCCGHRAAPDLGMMMHGQNDVTSCFLSISGPMSNDLLVDHDTHSILGCSMQIAER